MMKVFKRLSMVMAAIIGLSSGAVQAAQFGVCTHMGLGNNYSNESNIEVAGDVNAAWIRDEARWSYMQSGAAGAFKIRDKDLDYIKKVDEAGINQLLILAFGNTSYDKLKDTGFPMQDDPTYYNGFLDYVRYTVTTVGEYVDAYELWNEPNIEGFNYELQATGTDYAKLYLDVKQIVNELDPGAILLCGSITGVGTTDLNYAKEIFNYIKSQGNVNTLIDAFSIHIYNNNADVNYANALNTWEGLFDSYGFTGDVWMTENGVASNTDNNTEKEQASYIARMGARWENFLNINDRNGVNFWYDLRCDGLSAAEYEHNLGLVDYYYEPKPAFYAMKAYNDLTGGKEFKNFTSVKTKDNWISSDQYGYYAHYSDADEDVYVVYDTNNNSGKISIPLSGDVAYIYDYLGNPTETIINPSGSKSIDPQSEAYYVRCVDVKATADSLEYDEETGVLKVSGSYNNGDRVTVELVKDANVLVQREVQVEDGKFDMWFTYKDAGEYTIRVGKPEFEKINQTTGWAEQNISIQGIRVPEFDASTNVSYNEKDRTVTVTGKIAKYSDNQLVTIAAIPESMDINNVDFEALAYIGQVDAKDGEFSVEFTVPEYFETKMSIYLGGTDIASIQKNDGGVQEGQYVYVAGLDMSKGNTLSSSAIVRNFTDSDKKATMVIAQYDNAGRLVKMEISEKTVPAKTYKAIECSLKDVLIESGADSAKAFIVSDLTGFVPLAELDEKDI